MPQGFNPNKPVPGLSKPGSSTVFVPDKPVPHVVTPEGAKLVERAEGEFGDKVAIAGFSVSNFGIFASSEQGTGLFAKGAGLAAEFEGSVKVTGACDVTGDLHTKGDHIVDGDIQLSGADYAEDFDIVDPDGAAPGSVWYSTIRVASV